MNDQDKQKLDDLVKRLPELQHFAKALWGEADMNMDFSQYRGNLVQPVVPWKTHLQAMVIADDPIKYLGENI